MSNTVLCGWYSTFATWSLPPLVFRELIIFGLTMSHNELGLLYWQATKIAVLDCSQTMIPRLEDNEALRLSRFMCVRFITMWVNWCKIELTPISVQNRRSTLRQLFFLSLLYPEKREGNSEHQLILHSYLLLDRWLDELRIASLVPLRFLPVIVCCREWKRIILWRLEQFLAALAFR